MTVFGFGIKKEKFLNIIHDSINDNNNSNSSNSNNNNSISIRMSSIGIYGEIIWILKKSVTYK